MCGLFGFCDYRNQLRSEQRKIIAETLATSMDWRGGDSVGFYHSTPSGNDGLIKRVGTFKDSHNMKSIVNKSAFSNMLLGHTRKATTGKVIAMNSHPFHIGNVIGAHNGIVYNDHILEKKYGNEGLVVDSEHIFSHIAKDRPLDEIEAYGAITYTYSGKDPLIRLARFNGGELCIALDQDTKTLVWASTITAVENMAKEAGLNLTYYNIEDGKLYQFLPENEVLYSIGEVPIKASSYTYKWDDDDIYIGYSYGRGSYGRYTGKTNKTGIQEEYVFWVCELCYEDNLEYVECGDNVLSAHLSCEQCGYVSDPVEAGAEIWEKDEDEKKLDEQDDSEAYEKWCQGNLDTIKNQLNTVKTGLGWLGSGTTNNVTGNFNLDSDDYLEKRYQEELAYIERDKQVNGSRFDEYHQKTLMEGEGGIVHDPLHLINEDDFQDEFSHLYDDGRHESVQLLLGSGEGLLDRGYDSPYNNFSDI